MTSRHKWMYNHGWMKSHAVPHSEGVSNYMTPAVCGAKPYWGWLSYDSESKTKCSKCVRKLRKGKV